MPVASALRVAYASPAATIYHGDAADALPAIPTESVHLVIADPPYGKDWQSNRRADQFDLLVGDGQADRAGIADVLRECGRAVGQNRHLYVFGPADVLAGLKVTAPVELIWDKGTIGSGDLAAPWGPVHERISFAVSKWRHVWPFLA